MQHRESLHELIDAMPEGALESAERFLRSYQTWQREVPIAFEQMRERLNESVRKRHEEGNTNTGTEFISSGHIGGARFKPDGDGMASMTTSEGRTSVTLEIRLFRGYRLEFEERLKLSEDKRSLVYTQEIKGPKGKDGRYEIEFEVA